MASCKSWLYKYYPRLTNHIMSHQLDCLIHCYMDFVKLALVAPNRENKPHYILNFIVFYNAIAFRTSTLNEMQMQLLINGFGVNFLFSFDLWTNLLSTEGKSCQMDFFQIAFTWIQLLTCSMTWWLFTIFWMKT